MTGGDWYTADYLQLFGFFHKEIPESVRLFIPLSQASSSQEDGSMPPFSVKKSKTLQNSPEKFAESTGESYPLTREASTA